MSAETVVLAAVVLLLGGAVLVIPVCRNRQLAGRVAFAIAGLASLLAIGAALRVLIAGPGKAWTVWAMPQYASALRIYVDGLSAVFLILIALVSALSALYSIQYMEHYPEYTLYRYYPYFLLFVAGMYGIVVVTDLMVGFFLLWQLMTLSSYVLVRFEYKQRENVRAAMRYLIAMEAACGFILLGAGLLARGPVTLAGETLMRYDFDAISHGLPALLQTGGGVAAAGLLCFLVGFGIKAGMWPFGQLWLPAAHPAAPSPVSALLSGVVIKTGIYGLMRSFLWLVPAEALDAYPSEAWGLVLAALGTATLFIGTTQALGQDQSKRLLAFSSIGQVGYILLPLGACLALIKSGPADENVLVLAAIGFAASLFHTLNHGLFKSLLFLNAGSLLYATETQDLNQMGGLIKYMPATAVTTLVGAFAIAGVPLFNGFVSKWSIFLTTILGSRHAPYLAVCAVVAMLTSVLTLALFLKFFGTSFLSRVSHRVAERAGAGKAADAGWPMLAPQIALAALCVLLGLAPGIGYGLIQRALAASQHGLGATLAKASPLPAAGLTGVAGPAGLAVLSPLVVAAVVGALLLFAAGLSLAGGAVRRTAEPWLCGYAAETDQMRYGARNLYREVSRYLPWIARPPAQAGGNGAARQPEPSAQPTGPHSSQHGA
ncbi:MAG: dehydrogenase (quinone) [candidate division NC10 bacterium]|nr:dehydrogenase (quinone) [candidate division NC10 bacterium]